MDTPTASIASQYRTLGLACATLAAVGSIWYLYQTQNTSVLEDIGKPQLRRSGAVRRSGHRQARDVRHAREARRVTVEAAGANAEDVALAEQRARDGAPIGEIIAALTGESSSNVDELVHDLEEEIEGDAADDGTPEDTAPDSDLFGRRISPSAQMYQDDAETEHDLERQSVPEDSQRLQKLAYQIAKRTHDREGLIHHGVTCDECGQFPIVGPRYHCNNCPDFDLCETCEAKDNHLRTHVFTKVKIPASWGGKDPQPVWYPGLPHKLPATLDDPEHRAFRTELANKSNLNHNKIDGLYLQFTCMADVQHKGPGDLDYAISHVSFNQCFAQQLMTDKASEPNLIKTRLFAVFDTNGDDVIDFEEFVLGTAVIQSRDVEERIRRIFKGLDLDDDGYLGRKDCQQMFQAYYILNREILLGYTQIDRYAENAVAIQNGLDHKEHIASGRSLANYFNGGFPHQAGQDPPWEVFALHSESKEPDQHGDMIPRDSNMNTDDSGILKLDHEVEEDDLLSQLDVDLSTHVKTREVFIDEVARFCSSSSKPRYLTSQHVRTFDVHRDPHSSTPTRFRTHNRELWVAMEQSYGSGKAFLKVEPVDLEGHPDWKGKVEQDDSMLFWDTIRDKVAFRLKTHIGDVLNAIGSRKQRLRRQREEVGLEADVPPPDLQADGKNHGGPLIGGTGAAHTIFLVVRDALDELLDDLFLSGEEFAHAIAETEDERCTHQKAIELHLKHLFEEVYVEKKHLFEPKKHNQSSVGRKVPARADATRRIKESLRSGTSINPFLFEQYARSVAEEVSHQLSADEMGWKCVLWLLEHEAEFYWDNVGKTEMKVADACESNGASPKGEVADNLSSWRLANRHAAGEEEEGSLDNQDPTMPQFRPNSSAPNGPSITEQIESSPPPSQSTSKPQHTQAPAAPSTSDPSSSPSPFSAPASADSPVPTITENRLHHLTLLEAVIRRRKDKGGPGKIDLEDFETLMWMTNDKGVGLLNWVGGWVDLVHF